MKDVEIEKSQKIEAKAEAHVTIVTRDENDKETERDKHKKSVKILTINCNQVLKEVKKKTAEIVKLKGRRIFLNMLDDEIVAEEKDQKCYLKCGSEINELKIV